MKTLKKILLAIALVVSVVLIGWAGNLDHDEYIEVNSIRQSRMPFYYEN